jgi:hypothetical protein
MTGPARPEVGPWATAGPGAASVFEGAHRRGGKLAAAPMRLCLAWALVGLLSFGCASRAAEASSAIAAMDRGFTQTNAAAAYQPPSASNAGPSITSSFDEFAIRSAIRGVDAPAGSGLPNIQRLTLNPTSIFPIEIVLAVDDVDNAAWLALSDEERQAYSEAVMAAVVAQYPEVEADARRSSAYYILRISERFRISTIELSDLDEEVRCMRIDGRSKVAECRAVTVAEVVEIPAGRRA